jgi:cytochrome c oxidase subunit III
VTAIPYTAEARPDTGVNNVMLGMWLFLASEVMLFGGLFSAYVLLRSGAAAWPHGSDVLDLRFGGLNTMVLAAASAAFVGARRFQRFAAAGRSRALLAASAVLGVVFLGIKALEYSLELRHGRYPSSDTFLALYYLLTGVHALHIAGGLIATGYLALAGVRSTGGDIARFANRLSAMALYWYFVDTVWMCIFVLLYLA